MVCPMRVVYVAVVATVIAGVSIVSLRESAKQLDSDSGSESESESEEGRNKSKILQQLKDSVRTMMNPVRAGKSILNSFAAKRSWTATIVYFLGAMVLVVLHIELFTGAWLTHQIFDHVSLVFGAPIGGENSTGVDTDLLQDGVYRGTGCYDTKRHICSYDISVCCATGCKASGAKYKWIDGHGTQTCSTGAAGCVSLSCGV